MNRAEDGTVSGGLDSSPDNGSLRAKSAAGVIWMALQIWTVRSMSAVSFIIVGRQLMPTDFGLVALAGGIIAVLSIISDSGLATYIMRQNSLSNRTISTAFWTSLTLSVILAGILAAAAVPISTIVDEPGLTPVLLVLTTTLIFSGLNSVPNALMRRGLRFKSLAARGTAATLAGVVVAVTLALTGFGVWALVGQSIAQVVVNTLMLWRAVDWRPGFTYDGGQARTMLAFGSKLLSIDLMMQARDRGEEFMLAGFASTTTLGFWSVATRLIKLVQDTGSQVISSVATPAFAKLQDDLPRLYRAYETSMAATGVVIFPAMLFLAATSTDVVPLVLGEQWATTASIAQITAVTAAVGVFSYYDRSVFVAVNRLRPEMILVAVIIFTHLVVVLVTIQHGLMVLALGLLIRTCATFPLRQLVLHRVAGVPYSSLLRPFRVFLAATAMAALVWGSSWLDVEGRWQRVLLFAGVALVSYPFLLTLFARSVAKEFGGELRRMLSGRLSRRQQLKVAKDVDKMAEATTSGQSTTP